MAISGFWNDNFFGGAYFQRLTVCAAVSVIAVLAARNRQRTDRDRERFAVLSAAAEMVTPVVLVLTPAVLPGGRRSRPPPA